MLKQDPNFVLGSTSTRKALSWQRGVGGWESYASGLVFTCGLVGYPVRAFHRENV